MRMNGRGIRSTPWAKTMAAIVVTVSILALEFMGGNSMAQQSESVSESMGLLREYRTKAEYYAGVLKGMKSTVSESIYRHGEKLYVDGKASVDRWLKVFITDLKQGEDAELSPSQKQVLNDAAIKADTFIEFVDPLMSEDQKRGWSDVVQVIPDTITAVVDAGVKLWREFRGVSSEKRDAMIAELEDLRWKELDAITPK